MILPCGYEAIVRADMGVSAAVLSDADIQSRAALAEALIIKAVPNYEDILEGTGTEKAFLQMACIAQVSALLCPGMPNRVKVSETSETGYSYKLQDIDWSKFEVQFGKTVRDMLMLAKGDTGLAFSPLGVVTNDRLEV